MGLDMYLIKRKKSKKIDNLWDFDKDLMYWRKANQIHRYFCTYGEEIEKDISYKISKEILEKLLEKCNNIMDIVITEEGKIKNGETLKNGEWEPILQDGITIVNKDEIAEILPTQDGFFFGSTEYDQWYLDDIRNTKKVLEEILKEVDFENEDCFYLASW